MKPTTQKRKEALARLEKAEWKNSKAKREGTKSQKQWEEAKEKQIAHLKSLS